MSGRAPLWPRLPTALLWALAGALEAPALLLAAGWPLDMPAWLGVCAHAAAAGVAFFAPPKERGWLKPTRHWGEPLALLVLLLPGLGWAIGAWLLLTQGHAQHDKDAYRFDEETAEDVNPLAGAGSPQAVRRELADALDVLPAVDALLSRSADLKRGAIETLGRIRSAEAIGWIIKARSSGDPETRFYATTALTRLKRDFETAAAAAQKESWQKPADLDAQLALQRVRYEHATSGIMEADAAAAALAEARERLEPLSARSPEALRLLYLVTRRLEPHAALGVLDKLEAGDPGRSSRWTRERAEILFELGRHAEVRSLLRARRDALLGEGAASGTAERPWLSAVLWWNHD